MKSHQVLIALAVIAIGISAASASAVTNYPVVSGELRDPNIGQLDFGMSVDNNVALSAPTTSQLTYPTVTATNNGALLAFVQGATVNNVGAINAYMLSQSLGGDVAESHLNVIGNQAGITDFSASVKNYNIYGYTTSNLAYTGQYADSITGESINMQSEAWNKQTYVPTAPTSQTSYNGYVAVSPALEPALTNTNAYKGTTAAVVAPLSYNAEITPVPFVNNKASTGYSSAIKSAANSGAATDTSQVAMTTVYQFAQAGGSQAGSAYPQGIWTQAVNDKGAKISGVNLGTINNQVTTTYTGLNGLGQSANAAMSQTNSATLTSNTQEMGYADSSMVYANKDSLLAGNANTPSYLTTSSTNLNGVGHSSADTGGNLPVQAGQTELFAYSIVNAANPNGLSTHLFF